MKTRILFAEQFYYPEGWGGAQIPRDITTHLARSGFEVHVLCGSEQYAPQPAQHDEDPCHAGVTIRRLPGLPLGSVKRLRAVRQLWFCLLSVFAILLRRWPHLIVAQTNPAPLVPTLALLARLMRVPLVIIAQDIYPEVMMADGLLAPGSRMARLLGAAFGAGYRRARRVVALGPRMAERIRSKGVAADRITQISNWATGDLRDVPRSANRFVSEWGLTDKFVLLYSGNLGVAHDFSTIVHALHRLHSQAPNVHLVVIGGGSGLAPLRTLVAALALEDAVSFHPFVPAESLPESLGVAHLALVTLLPGFDGLVVPSKLLGHMARGIPTLYIGPAGSDVDILLAQSGGGVSVRTDEIQRTAERIAYLAGHPEELRSLGQSALSYYRAHLTREAGLAQYARLATEVSEHG